MCVCACVNECAASYVRCLQTLVCACPAARVGDCGRVCFYDPQAAYLMADAGVHRVTLPHHGEFDGGVTQTDVLRTVHGHMGSLGVLASALWGSWGRCSEC